MTRWQAGRFEFGLGRTQIFSRSVPTCKPRKHRSLVQYIRAIWDIAIKDAVAFWTAHRTATAMSGGFIGFIVSAIFRGFHGWTEIVQALVISLLSALGAFVVTFLVSVVKAPILLDRERLSEIKKHDETNRQIRDGFAAESSALRMQIEQLTPPRRTAAEEHHYAKAKTGLARVGGKGEIMLRHLRIHDKVTITSTGYPLPLLPNEMGLQEARECLDRCLSESLVTREPIVKQGFGISPAQEDIYQIASGMKRALDELLYPPVPS